MYLKKKCFICSEKIQKRYDIVHVKNGDRIQDIYICEKCRPEKYGDEFEQKSI